MDYITVSEAAKKQGCTRSWIHQLLNAGRIPGAKSIGQGKAKIFLIPAKFKITKKD